MRDRALILKEVGDYYAAKVIEHGATAQGADWNSRDSQQLRFKQLLTVCGLSEPFSLLDYGCGYGALCDFLREGEFNADYRGFDIAPVMLDKARQLHPDRPRGVFEGDPSALRPADFTVASGIFNVRLETGDEEWGAYVLDTLATLARLSRRGFAFNMLTSYSDPSRMRGDLYYGDPSFYFDHCKRTYSKNVALLHDYGLYEFTLIVRLGG